MQEPKNPVKSKVFRSKEFPFLIFLAFGLRVLREEAVMYLTSCREKILKIKKKAPVKIEPERKPKAVRRARRRSRPVPAQPNLTEIEIGDFEPVA